MNYRCVVLLGVAARVDDPAERSRALDVIVDHMVPGRSEVARPPSESELRKTLVLRLPTTEGSAKVRGGDAVDEPEDVALPIWAGSVPLRLVPGATAANAASSAEHQAELQSLMHN